MTINKKFNKSSDMIYDPMLDNQIPQYGFGSWLKKNAGVAGSIAGAGLGTIVAPGIGTSIGASLGGQVGGGVQSSEQQKIAEQQAQQQAVIQAGQQQAANVQNQPQYAPTFQQGGFIDFSGQTHDGINGGIPVDSNGNPSIISEKPTVALTEDNEVNWRRPDGQSYIFSDNLGFADDARKLMNKYKKSLGEDLDGVDELSREAMNKEFENLLQSQEAKRVEEGLTDDTQEFQNGGVINPNILNTADNNQMLKLGYGVKPPKKFQDGSFLPLTEQQMLFAASKVNPVQQFNPIGTIQNQPLNTGLADTTNINIGGQTVARNNLTPETLGLNTDRINRRFNRDLNMDLANEGQYSPQLSPAANIVNVLGNTADYFIAKGNRPEEVRFGRVSPQEVDLGRSREIARRDAETARNIAARNIRNLSGSAGQALSNLGASETASQRALGDITSRSIESEELANARARQQADLQNVQLAGQESQINTAMRNQYQDRLNQLNPLRSVLQQTGQYLTDAERNRRLFELARFQNPNLQIGRDPNVTGLQRFLGNRGARFTYRD